MPELDLGGWLERSKNYSAFLRVLATMLFPDDESQRVAVSTLPYGVSPNHPAADLAVAKYLENFHNGVWAGEVLFMVRVIAERHHDVGASISRAAIVLEANAKRCSLDGPRNFWADERTIRTAFYKYRSVAHLWAACSLLARATAPSMQALNDLDIDIAVEKTLQDLGVFLAVSENMRCFGEGYVLPRRKDKETLLDPAASWRAPLGVPLPDISVTVPALASPALEDLHSYRARVRLSI